MRNKQHGQGFIYIYIYIYVCVYVCVYVCMYVCIQYTLKDSQVTYLEGCMYVFVFPLHSINLLIMIWSSLVICSLQINGFTKRKTRHRHQVTGGTAEDNLRFECCSIKINISTYFECSLLTFLF